MNRFALFVMTVCLLAATGCRCHWQPFRCAPCGPGMGCGEWYFGDWHECCEPCDCHGNWIGGCHDNCGGCDSCHAASYFGGTSHEPGLWGGGYDYVDGPVYEEVSPAYPQASRHHTTTSRRGRIKINTSPTTARERHAAAWSGIRR